jgi:hypothetical protein
VIADLRGGRNGSDPPIALADRECVEALNVDWYHATVARKRGGATAITNTGIPAAQISFLGRHVPGTNDTLAELWAIDDSATPNWRRFLGTTAGSAPTVADAITGALPWQTTAVSMNGKFFVAYSSAQARLHCWDGSTVRRCGLAAPAAPTAGNTGAGTYAAVLRYYRVRWTTQASGVTVGRSEPGASVSFTPSGGGTAARVTRPTAAGESETHWELEGSTDNVTFYLLGTTILATTTYDDSAVTTTYSAGALSPLSGTYTLQKPYKYIAVDGNRVLGFGSWTSTDKQNRVEFSAIVGSTNVSDDERVPTGNYVDFDEADSGPAVGLVGPVLGAFYAFKKYQVWKLVPSGTAAAPYNVLPISKVVGAVSHQAINIGEDATGNPCIYFLSARGPYRLGVQGLEYLGHAIEDCWFGPTSTMYLNPSNQIAHGVFYTDKGQWWVWITTGANNDPDTRLMYDVKTNGWARHTGPSAAGRCSVMFAKTPTAGGLALGSLVPHVAPMSVGSIWKCDTTSQTDNGTNFQAYVLTKAYALAGLGSLFTVGQGTLLAPTVSGVTITQSLIRDLGVETRTATVVLTAAGSETRLQALIDGAAMAGCGLVQFQWGDAAAIGTSQWQIDAVTVEYTRDASLA